MDALSSADQTLHEVRMVSDASLTPIGALEDIRLRNCLRISLPASLLNIIPEIPVYVEIAHYL
jgi:hypothetical protein